jgi:hypothetical protein
VLNLITVPPHPGPHSPKYLTPLTQNTLVPT